jgi:hypothetical protein
MRNSVATSSAPSRSTARGYLPMFVFLAYTAFLLTGFGSRLGNLQPIPIYIFFSLLLLTLQETIAAHRSHGRFAYIFLTSAFSVLYAADLVFKPFPRGSFTLNPATYIVVNLLLVLIYLWDVLNRRRQRPEGIRGSLANYSILAADFAGLAVVFFVSSLLLDLLGPQYVLHLFGLHPWKPYIVINLNTALHWNLKSPIDQLQGFDFVAGLVATAITFLFLVIVGVLLPAPGSTVGGQRLGFNATLRAVAREAADQVSYSLSLVLGPLVWLVPAFSIAYFSQMVTRYLNLSATSKGTVLDLFNPFSETSRANYTMGLATLLLGLFALAMVVLAVAIVEHNRAIVNHTLRIFSAASRAVLLIWAFFIYSLAVINAIVNLLGITQLRPFQVGAPGLIALVLGIGFFVYESRRDTDEAPSPASRRVPSTVQTIPTLSPPTDVR